MILTLKVNKKTQLTKAIIFFSSKYPQETHSMHSKSEDIEIMTGNETDEIIEVHFESLLKKDQKVLENQ